METDVMSFSGMFSKTSNGGGGAGVGGQQKVVCTPEVSLYQYPSKMKEGIVALENEDGEKVGSGFVCNLCGKTFHQKNTFQNHLRSHREGDDPYQCDICHKTFAVPARLTRHYRTHTGEKPYQCEYCNKSFSVKENLSVHRRIHTKERPYKCDVCERAFEHSGKLHRHMRIHTGERPHRCNICQKTFIQSGQLVIHMRTHTGEKPYVCKVCNKGFTCSKQLKVHTRTHTGEKPYTCDICGKSFGYNHVLKLHQVAHYGEKVYKCTLCNGTFNSKKSLESHIKTHSSAETGGNPGTVTPPPSEPADSMSPQSSVYQTTPQHSDKENRGDASDSEISSQSSPPVGESPKSPGSPMEDYVKSLPEAIQHAKMMGHCGVGKAALPYPMLPPSVEVRQAPQSGTTFLYVTSKLPPHGYAGNQVKTTNNGPYSPPSQPRVITTNSLNLKTLQMGLNSPPAKETVDFNQNASIREKVLASIEKFGYGLSTNGISIRPATKNLHGSQPEYQRENGFKREAEHMSKYPKTDVSISEVPQLMRNRSRSPENSSYPGSFGHGGVLALALTRGSKAVVNMQNSQPSFPHLPSVTIRPRTISESTHPSRFDSPPHSDRSSPEIISEMHRRSVSPPGGMNLAYHRPTPSSTPGSSAGYSETNEDFSSDDYPHQPHSPLAGEKRRNSGSPCYGGPRKRSSLILEKYAQENSPPPTSASSPKPASPPICPKESILSQRLRMSSVIQYAEKCT